MSKAPAKKKKTAPETEAEKKNNEVTETKETVEVSSDDALDSFLSRSQEEKKTPEKRKLSRRSIILIAAIIAVAALIIVIVIIANQPLKPVDVDVPEPAEINVSVDDKGEHQVEIPTDSKGEAKQDGYGDLVTYVPSQITKIEVENTGGSFVVNASTQKGEATVYTISGFEDYELRAGMADAVANDAASVTFTSVAAVSGKPSDFGLDKPRATVKVTYTDDTTATIRVGNAADGGAGTYVAFGDSPDVFLVADDEVDAFLYNVLDMISYEITAKADSVDNDQFSVIKLSGTHYPDPITLVPNTDEAINADYCLTEPKEMFADSVEGNDISGSIRDLYAESVVCVNPSSGQLSSFGVAKPYAAVHAEYPDTQIDLSCSAPTGDGLVNLYNPDKGIIYTIRLDALGWANSDLDQLLPQTIIDVNKTALKHITVDSGGKTYDIKVKNSTETVKNESGDDEEIISTDAFFGKERITEENFNIFFQNINCMKNLGLTSDSGGNVLYQAKFSYTTGRDDDTLTIYDGGKSCRVELNGTVIGTVSKSHVNSLHQDIVDIKKGKTPKSL